MALCGSRPAGWRRKHLSPPQPAAAPAADATEAEAAPSALAAPAAGGEAEQFAPEEPSAAAAPSSEADAASPRADLSLVAMGEPAEPEGAFAPAPGPCIAASPRLGAAGDGHGRYAACDSDDEDDMCVFGSADSFGSVLALASPAPAALGPPAKTDGDGADGRCEPEMCDVAISVELSPRKPRGRSRASRARSSWACGSRGRGLREQQPPPVRVRPLSVGCPQGAQVAF